MILDLVCAKTLPLLAAKVENVFCILYIYFILYTCVLYLCSSFCIVVRGVSLLFSTLYQVVYTSCNTEQREIVLVYFMFCLSSFSEAAMSWQGKEQWCGASPQTFY